ncbi:Uncharacterised protein [Mycobacteroides abscessus subsp. abscessus]|nr:Uncharacterised protein [Mycobacteroides abscessus subsp. abscessus]
MQETQPCASSRIVSRSDTVPADPVPPVIEVTVRRTTPSRTWLRSW